MGIVPIESIVVYLLFLFLILTVIFSFFSWWVFPESDRIYRNNLDALFDKMTERSLFEIGRSILRRLLDPIQRFFTHRVRGYLIVGGFSLVLNAVVVSVGTTAVIATHFSIGSEGVDATISSIRNAGWVRFLGMNVLIGLLGSIFDILSLVITLMLLTRASSAETGVALIAHLCVDFLIATIACMWAYGIIDLTLRQYYTQILPHVYVFSHGFPQLYVGETLWLTLKVNPAVWYVVIGLGISAALPTIIYLLALLPVLVLRIIPGFIKTFLVGVVFRITVDEKPVLKQLSTFSLYGLTLLSILLGALMALDQLLSKSVS